MLAVLRTTSIALIAIATLSIFTARVVVPALTGSTAVVIHGDSMEPTIPFGSLAYAQPAEHYTPGDIVTYQAGSSFTTHRLIGWWNDTAAMTQGDANREPDPAPVQREQIIGRLTAYIPLLGWASQLLAQPALIAFVLLVSLAIIAWPAITSQPAKQTSAAA